MRRSSTFIALVALLAAASLSAGEARAQQLRPNQPDLTIDAATRSEVIETTIKRLNERYVFPDVAKKMEQALRDRVARKEYDSVTSARQFAEMLTAHLQEVSHDKHLRVGYSVDPVPEDREGGEPTAEEREQYHQFGQRINFGFERVERLPGNIGYVDMRGFFEAKEAADTLAHAMNFLNNTEAIIFDLRKNGGGDPEMVALVCSYLFGADERIHLNDLYWRKGDRTEEFWTKKELAGKRYGNNKDVFILTSNRTFSAAEEFTYNLKNLKRATIIGETTGGGANPGGGTRLSRNFRMFVPTGRAINPITKTNWEGTGVKPDVEVPAEQALKTAHIAALKRVIEKTTDARLKSDRQMQLEELEKEMSATKEKK